MKFVRQSVICGLMFLAPVGGFCAGKSLAEHLGYPPQAKLLIVHADDVGMSHNVNAATLEAMTKGWVSSASIMVPCPWFPEAAAIAKEHPDLDLGLHLTLTSEWRYYRWRPVAPIAKVRGLLDPEGYMWRGVAETLAHASPREIETEIRAQVRRALDFGIRPTHLDSHMGTLFASPAYFDAYRKVAHEFKLPYLVPRPRPELLARFPEAKAIFTPERLAQVESSDDVMIDYLIPGIEAPPEKRTQAYVELMKQIRPGVTELIIHCGGDTQELRAITSNWGARVADARAFTDPAVKKAIAEAGIKLIRWRDLKKLQYGE